MKKFVVSWGEGYEQGNLSRTEALKIASDLLKKYDFVAIKTDFTKQKRHKKSH